jgi:hypothetical protein
MLSNWVFQAISIGGVGDITLSTPLEGYIGINSVFNNDEEFFYTFEDGFNKETGIARYISSSNKIARVQIFETLVNGTYDNSSPNPVNLTTAAVLFIGSSIQGLTHNTKVWKEATASLIIPPSTSALVPDFKQFVVNVDGFHFSPHVAEGLGLRFNVDNDIAVGDTIFPKVHWSPTDANTGVVRWAVTLSVASLGGVFTDAGIIYLEQAGSGTAAHQMVDLVTSTILAPDPNAIIVGKIFRDSTHVNDTYSGDAVLHSVAFDYQADKLGTPQKNLDFNNWV